jgi:drug/metabolite transporter (DMT)-like permease
LLKLAGESKRINWQYIAIRALLWAFVALGWFVVYRKIKFSSAGFLYGITSSILLMIVDMLFFHEQINNYEKIGFALAIASFILLAKFA